MKKLKYVAPVLIGVGILALISLVYIAATRNLSSLESVLLQIISLAIGIGVSFHIGRQSALTAAREIVKPHARSAFRRLVSLYQSLQRVATMIESSKNSGSQEDYQVTLGKLGAIVTEQLTTADDALADWNDIVPEDVAELRQNLEPNDRTRDTQ